MNVNRSEEIRSQLTPSDIFVSLKRQHSIVDHLFEPTCKSLLKKWSFCRALALFNVVGILAIVALLTFLIIQARPRPMDNASEWHLS